MNRAFRPVWFQPHSHTLWERQTLKWWLIPGRPGDFIILGHIKGSVGKSCRLLKDLSRNTRAQRRQFKKGHRLGKGLEVQHTG